jgi:hypothetical protein
MSSKIAHFLIFGYDLEKFPGCGYLWVTSYLFKQFVFPFTKEVGRDYLA